MKKAITYCRVSSTNQNNTPSVESQQRNCEAYAKKKGYRIVSSLVGGRKETQAVAALLNHVEVNKVDYVIAQHPDRISRNQMQFCWLKNQLSKLGAMLRFANEDVDESPAGLLVEGILKAMNEYDSEWRTRRIKEGIKQAKLKKQAA